MRIPQTADEETGDTLNDAVYRRNSLVEDRYNIKLTEYQNNVDALKATMKLITAGDNTHSIYLLREEPAFNVVLQNGAVDYAGIPHLNLDREWWLQSSLDSMSIDNRVYFAISTFDTTHYDGTSALYFNKTLAESYDMEKNRSKVETAIEKAMTAYKENNG